jgi:tetratricopeptide (TPR) repeat protein
MRNTKFFTVGVGLLVCISAFMAAKLVSKQAQVVPSDVSAPPDAEVTRTRAIEKSAAFDMPRQELPTAPRPTALQATLAKRPKDHSPLMEIRSLLNAKNIDAATDLLQQQISADPSDDVYLEEMAILQLKLGKSEAAEEWLRKTIKVNPRNQVAMGELIELLETKGRTEESVDVLGEIIAACNGECPAANLALGEAFARSGDIDQASAQFAKAAESAKVKEAALLKLAAIHSENGDPASAETSLNEVMGLKRAFIQKLKSQGVDVGVLEKSLKDDSQKLVALKEGRAGDTN